MASFSPLQLFYGSMFVLFAFPLSTWSLPVEHTMPKDGFERMVAFWSQKRCVFPDPLTYKYDVVTGGFLLEPCSRLDPNSADFFNRELCYQFLDVSRLLCNLAPQQEYLKAEVLSQLVDNPQWNVCNTARALNTKQRFAFITQDPGACASHCMADNKLGQICKLLIAAVAKYEEALRASSTAGSNPAASQPAGSDKDTNKDAERPQLNVTSKSGDASGQQEVPSQANGEIRAPPPGNNPQDSQTGRGPESSASEQGNGGTPAPTRGAPGLPASDSEQENGGMAVSEQGNGRTQVYVEGDSRIPASEQGNGGTLTHIEGNLGIPPASEPGNNGTEAHTEGDSGIPPAPKQEDGGKQAHIEGNLGIPPASEPGNHGTDAHAEGDSGIPPAPGQGDDGTRAHLKGNSGRPPASEQRNGGSLAPAEGDSRIPASEQRNGGTPTQNGGDLGPSKSHQGDVETPIHAGAKTLQQGNGSQSTQQGGGANSENPPASDSPEGAKTPPAVDVTLDSPEGSLNMPVKDRTGSTSTSTSTSATPAVDMWTDEEDGDPVGNRMSVEQQLPKANQDVLQPQRPVPPQPALIPADGVQRLHHMVENDFDEDVPTSGHFMAYFVTAVVLCVAGYVIYHNKQKILAFVLEGRRDSQRRRASSGGNGGSTAKYTKLQPSVEEVMPSLEKSTTSKNYIY